ncbi:hypothetical protein PR048_031362 [Dryococelus australis]|uniref:Uncharacterized protein n=1 Tax=Dryococelus australis TaxID=614101 RepID=A0ABQ9G519_9NEOP|nr:hypothetical protein PR048_031362 [Dryococelus australis]
MNHLALVSDAGEDVVLQVFSVVLLAALASCWEDTRMFAKRGAEWDGDDDGGHDDYGGGHQEVKIVRIPVPHAVPVPVSHQVPVAVPQPYPVPVRVIEQIEVPVVKVVEVPVERHVPVKVEKPVPYPVEKPVPIHIEKHVPVPVYKPYPVKVPVVKYIHHYITAKHGGGHHH